LVADVVYGTAIAVVATFCVVAKNAAHLCHAAVVRAGITVLAKHSVAGLAGDAHTGIAFGTSIAVVASTASRGPTAGALEDITFTTGIGGMLLSVGVTPGTDGAKTALQFKEAVTLSNTAVKSAAQIIVANITLAGA
jgi:hypothetical protein